MVEATIDCRRLVEALTEYLEGTLPGEERLRLEAHVAQCDACARYLQQFRATVDLAGRVALDPLDAGTRAGLLQAFRGLKRV